MATNSNSTARTARLRAGPRIQARTRYRDEASAKAAELLERRGVESPAEKRKLDWDERRREQERADAEAYDREEGL
jgi:hypothetical protein